MTQISDSNVYDSTGLPPPSNVRGWLMGVHGYQEPQDASNKISQDSMKRKSSIASEDSVNLDELIKANYTLDVDDETDLPNLATLDLDDDSKDDFWNLDKEISEYTAKENDGEYDDYMNNGHLDSPELTWSPPEQDVSRTTRSGSINSDISLGNQYTRYGMTPMIYPSDSTSTCSRTPSRLSNYSASSQASSNTTATTGTVKTSLPRPSTTRSKPDDHHLLPRPTSRLSQRGLQRASHIPAPSSTPRLGILSSSKSTGGTSASKKLTNTRQSHIPSIYERSASPIRNSVFGRDNDSTATTRTSSGDRRPPTKSTGLRPPGHTRSSSRIGVRKL